MLYIGIDTGTHTGLAIWDSSERRFKTIETVKLHQALRMIDKLWQGNRDIFVRFEDARQRKWFNTHTSEQDRAKLQGAGSVKRDCNIWEEYLTDLKIPFEAVPPARNCTKLSPDRFKMLTKWNGRTSEHARDAAMLVWGR